MLRLLQFEVVPGPLPPLEAADALVYTRETTYNVANKHELHATFAPHVGAKKFGTGHHVHIALNPKEPQQGAPGASRQARTEGAFIEVIDHLPALSALMLPTPQSYWRVQDGKSAGGTYAC